MRRSLLRSTAFIRAAKRIVKKDPLAAESLREALTLLANDAFDPRLRSHKLRGDLIGSWACSAGYDLRIVFRLINEDGQEAILLQSVGTHDEVY